MLTLVWPRRWIFAALFLALGIASCTRLGGVTSGAPVSVIQQKQPLHIETYHLFDLGVTDIDGDGNLDLYTANHSARQSFVLGDGSGGFGDNRLFTWGLYQSETFPGLEDGTETPKFSAPGLYIFWRSSRLIFHAHGLPPGDAISGAATFFTPIEMESIRDFQVNQTSDTTQSAQQVSLTFSVTGEGEMTVTPQPFPRVGSPILLDLAPNVPLDKIFIGALAVAPPNHSFILMLQDRHGMVWNDFDEDGRADMFIAGGAVRGLRVKAAFRPYELFYQRDAAFQRYFTPELGFDKGSCPARQTGLVDFDNDDLLDVYVVCIRDAPNQLYRQSSDGTFEDIAGDVGLALPQGGVFAWLDVENDRDQDMLWAGENGFWLYENVDGHFIPHKQEGPRVLARKITIGDYDNDGDGDVFVASQDANLFYRNDDGVLTYLEPAKLGLPKKDLTANWIDLDNDGLLDLHIMPDGLYLQRPDHHFISTQMKALPVAAGVDARSARAAWFDADNDGFRDLIGAVEGEDKQWQVAAYRNLGNQNHWLEVVLRGPSGNRPALGAKVIISTSTGSQTSVVGWSEGSHYGMGHYRLYFGLGPADRVDTLSVVWPDGSERHLQDVQADQVLHLSRGE